MPARCPRLESLGADFSDGARLLSLLPRLRSLRLWWSLREPTEQQVASVPAMPQLEHLTLDAGSQAANLDYAVALVRRCPRLRVLEVAVRDTKHDRVLELALSAGSTVTRLRISSAGHRPGEAFEDCVTADYVFAGMPLLAELDINGVVSRRSRTVKSK